jgi:hypothetical protein
MTNLQPGDLCYFGRAHGEKTLGRVLHVNAKSVKVEQLEQRGALRDHRIGTKWRVAHSLVGPAGSVPPPAHQPVARRPEADILRDIEGIQAGLSPENLSCDGELSLAQTRSRAVALHRKLAALQNELAR